VTAAVWTAVLAVALGQPPAEPRPARLALTPAAAPVPALKYRLLPALPERTPGNAALWWLRAGSALTERRVRLTDKQYDWVNHEATDDAVSLDDVRRLVEAAQPALELADLAARREYCAWDDAPLTLKSFNLMMPDAQRFRELSAVLGLRCRLELADRQFDRAARTLQTGLALARHVAAGRSVIHTLIGLNIAAGMLRHAEEWVGTPGAPSLYWALTDVPRPFLDLRQTFENELSILDRSFPALHNLARDPKTPQEMRRLGEDLFRSLYAALGQPKDEWAARLELVGMTAAAYPEAKQYLLKQGRSAEQVEALPALQAVLIRALGEYDRWRDDTLKWAELPYPQAGPGLRQTQRYLNELGPALRVLPVFRVVPPLERVALTRARLERKIAGLRCVEAVRLFAATHDGKLPAALDEIKEVPVPVDPMSGRPFGYTLRDGRAVLTAPAPAGEPAAENAWRYELAIRR
jgi:hypothetical protein